MTINLSNLSRYYGDGYSIAFSQPEAHTKRFSLAGEEADSRSGYSAQRCCLRPMRSSQTLDRERLIGFWNILWLNASDAIRR